MRWRSAPERTRTKLRRSADEGGGRRPPGGARLAPQGVSARLRLGSRRERAEMVFDVVLGYAAYEGSTRSRPPYSKKRCRRRSPRTAVRRRIGDRTAQPRSFTAFFPVVSFVALAALGCWILSGFIRTVGRGLVGVVFLSAISHLLVGACGDGTEPSPAPCVLVPPRSAEERLTRWSSRRSVGGVGVEVLGFPELEEAWMSSDLGSMDLILRPARCGFNREGWIGEKGWPSRAGCLFR